MKSLFVALSLSALAVFGYASATDVEPTPAKIAEELHNAIIETKAESSLNAYGAVNQVICAVPVRKDGKMTGDALISVGSGTVIEKGKVLTANHVVNKMELCTYNGVVVDEITYQNSDEDIATLRVETGDITPLPISCKGFEGDRLYRAFGYPGGYKPLVMALLISTDDFRDFPVKEDYPFESKHLRLFIGYVMTGMSGGPIIDLEKNVTGVITAQMDGWSAHRDLKETSLCRK